MSTGAMRRRLEEPERRTASITGVPSFFRGHSRRRMWRTDLYFHRNLKTRTETMRITQKCFTTCAWAEQLRLPEKQTGSAGWSRGLPEKRYTGDLRTRKSLKISSQATVCNDHRKEY